MQFYAVFLLNCFLFSVSLPMTVYAQAITENQQYQQQNKLPRYSGRSFQSTGTASGVNQKSGAAGVTPSKVPGAPVKAEVQPDIHQLTRKAERLIFELQAILRQIDNAALMQNVSGKQVTSPSAEVAANASSSRPMAGSLKQGSRTGRFSGGSFTDRKSTTINQ